MFTVNKFLKLLSVDGEELEKAIDEMSENDAKSLLKYFVEYLKNGNEEQSEEKHL